MGSSSLVFSSSKGGSVDPRALDTEKLLQNCLQLLGKNSDSTVLTQRQEAFTGLLRSGFTGESRTISDTSGIRFRMNLDYLYQMLQRVKGKTVAILGSSSGEEGLIALLFGAKQVVLSDINAGELNRALELYNRYHFKKLCPKGTIKLLRGNCLGVPLFKKQKFDFILAHNLVHFFGREQMKQFKHMILGMVKGNSYVYMTANPCSHARYCELRKMRLSNPGSEELLKTIGVFPKRTLLGLDPLTGAQSVVAVDPGYDAEKQKFYLDSKFPHEGVAFSRPLEESRKAFRTRVEVKGLVKSMTPYLQKATGLTTHKEIQDFIQSQLGAGQMLFGMADQRVRRVFTPKQLAGLFIKGHHELFALESCAFFNPRAMGRSAGAAEAPVQACREEKSFAGNIPKSYLMAAGLHFEALPCVILRALELREIEPLSVPLSEAELRELLRQDPNPSSVTSETK